MWRLIFFLGGDCIFFASHLIFRISLFEKRFSVVNFKSNDFYSVHFTSSINFCLAKHFFLKLNIVQTTSKSSLCT